jgi:acyl dehydratase
MSPRAGSSGAGAADPGAAAAEPDRDRLHLEDFVPGRVFALGSAVLTPADVVAFAREWDPQPFHLDDDAARDAGLGGLMASGWQTACVWMRLYVDEVLSRGAMLPAPGIDELRWVRPVRPGMRLHGRATILDAQPSERDPARGRFRLRGELLTDEGDPVLTMTASGRAWRRSAAAARTNDGGPT